jgi:hypothetical protein
MVRHPRLLFLSFRLCLTERGCLGKLSDSARNSSYSSYLNQKTGGTAVTSVSIGNFRTAETRENAV